MSRLSCCIVVDNLLGGGFERGVISTVYGPSGSGKSNIAILTALQTVMAGHRVVYIDTEASFSVERAVQLCPDFSSYSKRILFFRPTNFSEQKKAVESVRSLVEEDSERSIALVIIDSIAMLYRIELGLTTDVQTTNRELGIQLGYLTELARKYKVAVLITNQVYADFENKSAVKLVGGDLLKYSSKCLLELKKFKGGVRTLQVVRHRSLPESSFAGFRIVQSGLAVVSAEQVQPVENAYEE